MSNPNELTPKEQRARQFMEERFLPALHAMLEDADPLKYATYGGNACRQTAILGMHFLSQLLPEYKWRAWEGEFDDIINGKARQYDHAWLYGVGPGKRRLLVDLARKVQERLFMLVTANNYPKDHPEYIHMKERKRTKIDVDQRLTEREWYTLRTAADLLGMLEDRTQLHQWLEEVKLND